MKDHINLLLLIAIVAVLIFGDKWFSQAHERNDIAITLLLIQHFIHHHFEKEKDN